MPIRARKYTSTRQSTAAERAYEAQMAAARRGLYAGINMTKVEVVGILREARTQVQDEILKASTGKVRYVPADLAALQTAIDVALTQMDRRLHFTMGGYLQRVLGIQGAPAQGVTGAGLNAVLPGINVSQLELAVSNSHGLVTGFTNLARKRLRDIMVQATLAHRTPHETMADIRALLKAEGRGAPPGRLAYEAERIYRTEGMRIANLANYASMQETASRVAGAQKRWIHGGGGKDPREHHVALDNLVIPMDEDFVITDPKGNRWRAFGPHDPALPPGEVINCTCTLALVLPGYRLYDATHKTSTQRGIRRSVLQREWEVRSVLPQAAPALDALHQVRW